MGCNDSTLSEFGILHSGWMVAQNAEHLVGPSILLFPDTSTPSTLYCPLSSEQVILREIENGDSIEPLGDDSSNSFNVKTFEPNDVHQVFVFQPLPGFETGNSKWFIKSAEGKYLSADKYGSVACNKSAVGETEQWELIIIPESRKVALKSIWGFFLKVNQPQQCNPNGTWILRCDSDSIGFCESFVCKVQAETVATILKKRRKESHGRTQAPVDEISGDQEGELLKKYQSWGGGRTISPSEKSTLRQAKLEGKMGEALLDRRSKMKSDKYCK
jgi:protein FRG1